MEDINIKVVDIKNINVKVVDISAKIIIDVDISKKSYLNQIYNMLYSLYFHCNFDLLFNKKIITPLEKISNLSNESIIIFDIVTYQKLNFFKLDFNSYLAINNNGLIIDWMPEYQYPNNDNLNNYNFLKNYLNYNYNCLSIIKICNIIFFHAAVLFENGLLIILCYNKKKIIHIFHNVTKILKTTNIIGILINNNKLITCNYLGQIFKDDNLTNLDYKYIYSNSKLFFIIGHQSITIVTHKYYPYPTDKLLILKYNINNIYQIYDNWTSSKIAIIKENNSLLSFNIVINYHIFDGNIILDENIDNPDLKIKKILCIDISFVALTYDNLVFIWGNNKLLIDFYDICKNELVDVEDIVVTNLAIGILKKNNTIIIISIYEKITIYRTCIDIDYTYIKFISTKLNIFGLADNNKVYQIKLLDSNYSCLHIEIFNDIKELYKSKTDILVVSNDNIIYAYNPNKNIIYYQQQILDFKSIRIHEHTFIIIRNNGELIKINDNDTDTFNNIVKFIKF